MSRIQHCTGVATLLYRTEYKLYRTPYSV